MKVLDLVFHDLAHSLRRLVRARSFVLVATVTLALAIGANTAVFTLIDRLLLRSLPVKEPDTLVLVSAGPLPRFGRTSGSVSGVGRRPDGTRTYLVSYELFSALAERVPALAESFAQCTRPCPVLVVNAE